MSANSLPTSRSSMETTKTDITTKTFDTESTASLLSSKSEKSSRGRRAWEAIKKHAKEHHESVNASYTLYYGQGAPRGQYMIYKRPA